MHFYAGTSAHGNYRIALEAAYCNDFPVFVTEWGTSEASGGGSINTNSSNTWISLLEAAKVSHTNWSLSRTNESSAALTGTSITASGGTTASGTYVRNLMRLNNGASLTDVGLTERTINCPGTSLWPNKNLPITGRWSWDAHSQSFAFESSGGHLAIYSMSGERKALFSASGHVSLNSLPHGTYIAIFRRGSDVNQKLIHLK